MWGLVGHSKKFGFTLNLVGKPMRTSKQVSEVDCLYFKK